MALFSSIIGKCAKLRDSAKAASTLGLFASVSGTYSWTSTGLSQTQTVTLSGTITQNYDRATFTPRNYYLGTSLTPDDGKFWLGAPCCCAKCRAFFFLNPKGGLDQQAVVSGNLNASRYTVSSLPSGGDGTVSIDCAEQAQALIRADDNTVPCKTADDAPTGPGDITFDFADLTGGILFHQFSGSPDMTIFSMAKDWTLTASDGSSDSGTAVTNQWPRIPDTTVQIPICDATWSANVQVHWTGTCDDGLGNTYTLDVTLYCEIDLT